MNKNDKLTEILAIEDKYGLMLFGMALTHLIDVGVRSFTDEYVSESIAQIEMQGKSDMENGRTPVMTPEFQCAIIRCSYELSKFSIWELISYIKKYLTIEGQK